MDRCNRGIRGALHVALGAIVTAISASSGAIAQPCEPAWLPTVGAGVGVAGDIYELAVFDDGTGPAVYAGGSFAAPGSVPANKIARWDGQSWSPLGSGITRSISKHGNETASATALVVFDDGTGPALYVGGGFTTAGGAPANNIAKWDGQSWSPLGSGVGEFVQSLAVFDDGTGPALYAGGSFTTAGGVAVNAIAKWDGTSWSPLGSGFTTDSILDVYALSVFDDGTGSALYAGGHFTTAGGVPTSSVAKWDGAAWSPLGSGINGHVLSQAVYDDGSGPALYVGGAIDLAGGAPASNIAKWDGQSWWSMGSGANGWVRSLYVFDDGTGPVLVAGGSLDTIGGVAASAIASWDGLSWSTLGTGVAATFFGIRAMTVFNDGSGPALFVGSQFKTAGGAPANNIAKWDGLSWSSLGSGLNSTVQSLSVFDDGTGPALYVGGSFLVAGGVNLNHIAKWDGQTLLPMGNGLGSSTSGSVVDLAVLDHGAGPMLYAVGNIGFHAAGGSASGIARWDGQSWMNSNIGGGLNSATRALAVFNDGSGAGPALYVGGAFTLAGGSFGIPASRIAKWDGATWSPVGSGVSGTNTVVNTMTVFDDGSLSALYAGGHFSTAGGFPANMIARWDGKSWAPLGSGLGDVLNSSDRVLALAVFDDGTGPALYAGGLFAIAGGVAVNNIAKWNGQAWSPVGSGTNDFVSSLTVFDDGSGPALYAGGPFTAAGGVAANGVARWDGQSWASLGSGMQIGPFPSVDALAVFDDGAGPALFAGGSFNVSIAGDSYFAKYQGCAVTLPPNPSDFNGDGVVNAADLATLLAQWGPCPPPPAVCAADLNGDGIVNAVDLATLLANWG